MSTAVSEVIHRFNHAFVAHDPRGFEALVGEECVMEAIEPAPDGARYEGKAACVGFWMQLIEDRSMQFTAEHIEVATDTATIRWRLRFGPGAKDYVRGVNLMRVRDGRIVEALGYGKTPAADDSPLANVVDAEPPSEG
jgi:ketosteroid isomerase-like protein